MDSFPVRGRRTVTRRNVLVEVALIGKTVLYSDVGERVIAIQ